MSPDDEDRFVTRAEACGTDIHALVTGRNTGRMQDVVDLAYAYHLQLALTLRDAEVTDEHRLALHAIVERVSANATARAAEVLAGLGRSRI